MKFLLIIPLIFSWNFIFWGTIGFLRYLHELVSRNTKTLVPLALAVLVFLVTAYPASTVSDTSILILCGVICIAGFLCWRTVVTVNSVNAERENPIEIQGVRLQDHTEPNISQHNLQQLAVELTRLKGANPVIKEVQDSLILYAQSGDILARHELMDANQHLIQYAVNAYADTGLLKKDLRHLATVGLSQAIRTYNRSASYSFSSHALLLVTKSIENSLPAQRLPTNKQLGKKTNLQGYSSDTNSQRDLTVLFTLVVVATISATLWTAGFSNYNENAAALPAYALILVALSLLIPGALMAVTSREIFKANDSRTLQFTLNTVPNYLLMRHQVAILIPAYNEGVGIEPTVKSAIQLVGSENVFVVNDCSSDNTSDILKTLGINQLDLKVNAGKAKALDAAIKYFRLCYDYQFLLILDADTEIDCDYLKYALPKFDDPEVSVVAGHAIPKWDAKKAFSRSSFYVTYRIKLYLLTQAFLRYGQTTSRLNVSFIIPGFSSIYRTRVIPKIDITAPGLVIEDFNMTFELHKKKLGRIAYSPRAVARCHEPHSFKDYTSQIKRWHLGFWQTVVRHGFWKSQFSLALSLFILESLVISLGFIALPIIGLLTIVPHLPGTSMLPQLTTGTTQLFFQGVLILLMLDWASTAIIAWITKNPALLWHGIFFFVLRWVDSLYFLLTLPMVFFVKSNGRWTSPSRSIAH